MTRRISSLTITLRVVEEHVDSPPRETIDTTGADLDEVSRIVETLRPGLAKAMPRGAYELPRRKVGVR